MNNTHQTIKNVNLKDFSTKVLHTLKDISQDSTYSQLQKYIGFVKEKINVAPENLLKEYIAFRDKSKNEDQETLVLTLFYYIWVHESLIRSVDNLNITIKSKSEAHTQENDNRIPEDKIKSGQEVNKRPNKLFQVRNNMNIIPIESPERMNNSSTLSTGAVGDLLFGEKGLISKTKIDRKEREKSVLKSPAKNKHKEKNNVSLNKSSISLCESQEIFTSDINPDKKDFLNKKRKKEETKTNDSEKRRKRRTIEYQSVEKREESIPKVKSVEKKKKSTQKNIKSEKEVK